MTYALLAAALVVAALGFFLFRRARTEGGTSASPWDVGPTINGKNISRGSSAEGNLIRIGAAPGSAHYVTQPGSVAGKNVMRVRFKLDAPVTCTSEPGAPPLATLYFQRNGDDWLAQEKEAYRWYATFATVVLTGPGEYEMAAPLTANWTAVLTSSRSNNRAAFDAAVADCGRVGFVLGGGTGFGHGVCGPATLEVLSFVIE